MNMKISSLALATLCLSGNALAQVTVAVPDTIEVLVANGETPKLEGSLFDAHKSLVLPDGENQILFRYKPYFSQGNDRIIVESPIKTVKICETLPIEIIINSGFDFAHITWVYRRI